MIWDQFYFWPPQTAWHWLALGVLLIGAEILTPSTFLMWPAMSAALVGVMVFIDPALPWQVTVLVFAIMALVSNVLWINWQRKHPKGDEAAMLNRRVAAMVGRKVTVESDFANGEGAIKVGDSVWRARSKDGSNPAKGTTVTITGGKGATLEVEG